MDLAKELIKLSGYKLSEDAKSETADIRKDVKEIVPTYQYE